MTAMAMVAAIRNAQRHRYLVTFFRNSTTPFCHGCFLIKLVSTSVSARYTIYTIPDIVPILFKSN